MKEKLVVYIPMDRRHAIAGAEPLPDHTTGAALFADISGFTVLAEALVRDLGPQRGAEELTHYLNLVYDVIIDHLHHYGGSVISFAGDAITCWLDGDDGRRAVGCGLAMQESMAQFAQVRTPSGSQFAIGLTVAVATGPARRFRVGDPRIRVIDALTGETLVQVAAAEHLAQQGEVILDAPTMFSLHDVLQIGEVRTDPDSDLKYGVVRSMKQPVAESPWPPLDVDAMDLDEIRSWLLPFVYERIMRGLEEFLAELRSTVALFLRFGGIDYDDDDDAGQKLDAYIRWVQQIVEQYQGTLTDLNIGDKGSYIYVTFGAPVSHENNAEHAALAALELRRPPAALAYIDSNQIGISQGRMRTGVYGGAGHRTYGVLGDEVNLAARLMMAAQSGQILISQAAQKSIADTFLFERLPAMRVKGKQEPVTLFSLVDVNNQQPGHFASYALPMVGRVQEVAEFEQLLANAAEDHGQIVGLVGEAGVGKSRLVAEVLRLAEAGGWESYFGACESRGQNSSYLVWGRIWRDLLSLDPAASTDVQIERLTEKAMLLNPQWIQRLPLLDAVLQLPIPESDLTGSLDAKVRKTSLHSLLIEILRVLTATNPTLIVLEDCHWLDPLSAELLKEVGGAVYDRPVCLLLVSRESPSGHLETSETAAPYVEIQLSQFGPEEAGQLIRAKLAQLSGNELPVPEGLIDRLVTQSQGNPFYLEELIAYLYFQGWLEENGRDSIQPELPESLHRLVLSRLDQLPESQRVTARVASVIGRIFRAEWLWGAYPSLGTPDQVYTDMEALRRQDLTADDPLEPEQTYFFKQLLTQNVTYESLPFAMRSAIHEQIGRYIEEHYPDESDNFLDLLAHHYDNSENRPKRIEYLLRAGEAAQAKYNNVAAIDYYSRVLPLLPQGERIDVQLKLGQVLELTGRWGEAKALYAQALVEVQQAGDQHGRARCETAMGELLHKQGEFEEAWTWLDRAQTALEDLEDLAGLGQVLHYKGTMAAQQGDYERARTFYEHSLNIRQQVGDRRQAAYLLGNMGIIAYRQGAHDRARDLYEQSLAIRRELGDRWGIANSLNNLGILMQHQGDLAAARQQLEEAVTIHRQLGDRWEIGNALNNLGNVARAQVDFEAAGALYAESLTIYRQLGDKWALSYLLEDVAGLFAQQGHGDPVFRLLAAADLLREEIGAPRTPTENEKLNAVLEPATAAVDSAQQAAAQQTGRLMSLTEAIDYALGVIDTGFRPVTIG